MPGHPASPRPRLARLARWLIGMLARHAGHLDQEARLHAVLDHLSAMVARFDLEGRCLFVNERALQIYGLRLEQALGLRLLDLLSAEDYALYSSHLPQVLTGNRARFAGDEFVVILEGLCGVEPLEVVAQKIAQAMAQPMLANGTALKVSTSIGGLLVPAQDERTPLDLLKAADEALYQTKAQGRDGCTIVPLAPPALAA